MMWNDQVRTQDFEPTPRVANHSYVGSARDRLVRQAVGGSYILIPRGNRLARSRLQLFAPVTHEDNCGEGPQDGILHSR